MEISRKTNREVILKAEQILKENCLSIDDSLKSEKLRCYTVQKKAHKGMYFENVKNAFFTLGYNAKVESQNDYYITYSLPY